MGLLLFLSTQDKNVIKLQILLKKDVKDQSQNIMEVKAKNREKELSTI